jgi:hypothetical protein
MNIFNVTCNMSAFAAQSRRYALGFMLALGACSGFAQTTLPDAGDLEVIRTRLLQAGLSGANVRLADDGRVELVGSYETRREVQTAFSIAQQAVGVSRVAPTTPDNIRFPIDNSAQLIREALAMSRVTTTPVNRVPQRFALVVGVKEFRDRRIHPLTYTVRDAQAFHSFLQSSDGGNFPRENITMLVDRSATVASIGKAMDDIVHRARRGDTVVLYFSTHGTPLNDRSNMGIVAYDTEVIPRERIFFTSVSDDKISAFVRMLPGVNVMIVMDTCYSGMAFSKVPGFLASGAKDLYVEEDKELIQGVPATSLYYLGSGGNRSAQSLPHPATSDTSARILISASDGHQRSWESAHLKNSFFTYHFLQGLKLRRNVAAAYEYAKPVVIREVQREKKQQQTPQAVFLPAEANIEM